jgi:hypothetical protein
MTQVLGLSSTSAQWLGAIPNKCPVAGGDTYTSARWLGRYQHKFVLVAMLWLTRLRDASLRAAFCLLYPGARVKWHEQSRAVISEFLFLPMLWLMRTRLTRSQASSDFGRREAVPYCDLLARSHAVLRFAGEEPCHTANKAGGAPGRMNSECTLGVTQGLRCVNSDNMQ